ncbi:MAG TPA: hypothetical protein VGF44_06525 [Terriglobales bacterium]
MPATLHSLLDGVIDYAGLFPPADLSLEQALQNYSEYRSSPNARMLGRFIVQASRLSELGVLLPRFVRGSSPWKISVLIKDSDLDMECVAKFNRDLGEFAIVDSMEFAPELFQRIETMPANLRNEFLVYYEIPLNTPVERLHAIEGKGARAKARTGGVKPEAIPGAHELAMFVTNCAQAGVPFKATAGLHHPIRSMRALTYESNAPKGKMHGFLNLLMAACLACAGKSTDLVREVLSDENASSFSFNAAEARWKQESVSASLLQKTREGLFISFGSCSFDEPVEDLMSLGWL